MQNIRINANTKFEQIGESLIASGVREEDDESLYSSYTKPNEKEIDIKLIPYYRWGNRGENEMSVYIRI